VARQKDAELATLNWVHCYTEMRLYSLLGDNSRATAESNFYNAERAVKIAAE